MIPSFTQKTCIEHVMRARHCDVLILAKRTAFQNASDVPSTVPGPQRTHNKSLQSQLLVILNSYKAFPE